MRNKGHRCKHPSLSEHRLWNFFIFAGVQSLETGGHLVSDEAGRVKGHPWKRNEESGEPHNSESSCQMGCVARKAALGLMIQDFNNTWTVNFQKLKLVLEKAEEPEIKLPASAGSSKTQESSRKTSISALLTMPKPLICGSQETAENSERDGNTRPPDLPLEKSVCRSRNNG